MPEEARAIIKQLRSERDENVLDLVRDLIDNLNVLGDRLDAHVRSNPTPRTERHVSQE